MSGMYDDIICLPHPTSSKHPRMSMADRAAQFLPFAALTSYGAAVSETARLTDQKVELGEDAKASLDQKQRILSEHIEEHLEISVTWFQPDERKAGGQYLTSNFQLKRIDVYDQTLVSTDGRKILLECVIDLDSDLFHGLL